MDEVSDNKPIVVFLDDEPAILKSLERTFRREMFQVRTTEDPKQALEWVDDPAVKLIISDYRMAAMTGLEVLKAVYLKRPKLKRFILSGFADEELIRRALAEGEVDQYLLKPWNVDDLRARILSAVL
jgi:response regulator RpfG family c-di-GMP phosphodiesterase